MMLFSLLRCCSLFLDSGLVPKSRCVSVRAFTMPCLHHVCDHKDLAARCSILPTPSHLQIPRAAIESMKSGSSPRPTNTGRCSKAHYPQWQFTSAHRVGSIDNHVATRRPPSRPSHTRTRWQIRKKKTIPLRILYPYSSFVSPSIQQVTNHETSARYHVCGSVNDNDACTVTFCADLYY